MNREEIAGRINALLGKKQNTVIAKALHVSREAVRQWRKAETWPRLEKMDALAIYCDTTPEYILFGIQKEKPKVHEIRERICEGAEELALVRAYRASNDAGRDHILASAKSISKDHPKAENVFPLRRKKRKP